MSDLSSLDATAAVALFLFSLASRPLPQDFPQDSATVVRVSRRHLHRLAVAASLDVGLHAFNAALADLAGSGESVPALRLVSHAGTVLVDVGLLDLDDEIDEAWLVLLSVSEALLGDDIDEDDEEAQASADWLASTLAALPGLGLDTATALPVGIFAPTPGQHLPTARRCTVCGEVKTAEHFANNGSRLLSRCLPCDAARSRAWRRAHPAEANKPRHRKRKTPTGASRPRGFTLN